MTNAIAIPELQPFAYRLRTTMRGGNKLSEAELYALAQVATVTNLNPFIGEVWYIPGSGPMIGIVGARRLFGEQGHGNNRWVEIIPCDPDEAGATEAEIKTGIVVAAFRATAHDSAAISLYIKQLADLASIFREGGEADPIGKAREIVGNKPAWQGWGYTTKNDRSKMNLTQLARKRAEADALKKVIQVPFEFQVSGEEYRPADDVIEARAEPVSELPSEVDEVDALFPTVEQARQVIVKVGGQEKLLGELSPKSLNFIIANTHGNYNDELRSAAQVILREDHGEQP